MERRDNLGLKDEIDYDYEDHEDKSGFENEWSSEQVFSATPF